MHRWPEQNTDGSDLRALAWLLLGLTGSRRRLSSRHRGRRLRLTRPPGLRARATEGEIMPSRKVRRSPTARSTVPKRATRKPRPPFPRQHQSRPGLERRLSPRPAYQAPSYRAAGKLEGQVALITGGDSGIGRAVAVLFAREGADIAIVHLPIEASDARETERSILALGRRALLLPGDLTRPAFARSAVARTMAAFGRIDLLVNNAAYQHHREELGALSDAQ